MKKLSRNSEQITAGNVIVVHECVVLQSEIQLPDVCFIFCMLLLIESDAAGFIFLVATDANLRAYLCWIAQLYLLYESHWT